MKRSVLLSTFLFAAVLAPVLLQSNYCDTDAYPKLARLELYVPDINGENVIGGFNPDYVVFEVELPLDPPDTAVLLVQAQDTTATIEVTYDSLPVSLGPNGVAPLTLAPDHSEIRISLTAQDGKVWTYTVSIDRVDYCPCDDGNECTYDICYAPDQVCVYRAVPDGTYCGGGIRGNCFGGVCNFVPVSVAIGPSEVVFDWTNDRCEDYDLPDVPAKVARAEDGELVLFANHAPINRVMRGPDFDTLQHVCDPPALVSADLPTPDSYENREWLWSIYREGSTWHALIHNEFHDPIATTCKPGDPSAANPCAYISVTYAASVDGAWSFAKPSPPAHVVAPHTEVWTPPPAPLGFYSIVGYTGTSDIVRAQDGYYYALLWRDVSSFTDEGYLCLMRTSSLHDPASWRAWSSTGFDIRMESPYVTGEPTVPCARLPSGGGMASLTYNTYLDLYMVVNNGGDPSGLGPVCGIYLWLSHDLIHWSDAQLIAPARIFGCDPGPQTQGLLDPLVIWLPSIIDHADSSTNFERPGRTPYLYYTRFNDGGLDRDLVRVPLTFTMTGGPLCEGVDCDDANVCTEDLCNGADGSCEHTPVDCADSNDCTVDTCNPTIGCEYTAVANGTPCGGGLGTCQGGSCAATAFSQSVTVSNVSSGVLTDFQIPVDLSPGNFNYAGVEADGSDLRFSSDGEAFDLPYWIETWNPSGASRVWVKVPSIPANGNVDIYLLYGNPVLSDASNGDDTFEFFDDFEDSGYTDKWDVHGTPSILAQSSGELRLLGQSNWEYVSSKTIFDSPVQVFADVRQTINGGMIIADDDTDLRYTFRDVGTSTATTFDTDLSSSNQFEDSNYPLVVYTQDADHRIELAAQLSGNQIQMQYFCSTGECNNDIKTFTQIPFSGMRFGISSFNSDIYLLLIFVTKYAGGDVSVVVN